MVEKTCHRYRSPQRVVPAQGESGEIVGRGVISGVRESSNSLSSPDSGADLDDSATGGTVSRALPADLTAVREARSVVQRVLSNWQAEAIFDDVVLVASELVANALRHGLRVNGGDRNGFDRAGGGRLPSDREDVRISLVSTGSHVICVVTDPSQEPPVRQSADPLAASGRGLQLVESLSLCWGWTLLDDDRDVPGADPVHGKSVWAIFPLTLARPARVVGAA
jgi:Histidine kinase-like ATPase domain